MAGMYVKAELKLKHLYTYRETLVKKECSVVHEHVDELHELTSWTRLLYYSLRRNYIIWDFEYL